MLMEMCMKVSGEMTRQMGSEFSLILIMQDTKENG